MAIGITDSKHYKDIADAIREKSGDSGLLLPGDMAQAIEELPAGGGDDEILEKYFEGEFTDLTLNVEKTPTAAFYYHSELITINLPKCKSVGTTSFQRCSNLTTVFLPVVEEILINAFINADKLETVVVGSESSLTLCTLSANMTISSAAAKFYVPDHQLEQYKEATNWVKIIDRIHPQSELSKE